MKDWPVQDAKARFSEMLDDCLIEGPQIVTRRGIKAAVLVPINQWQRLKANTRPTLKALLMSDIARGELILPARGRARRSKPLRVR